MQRILLVGEDFRLLATRAAILTRTGASTVCCSFAEMMHDLNRGEQFDLIVLCHSLPEDAVRATRESIRERWPRAKVLRVLAIFPRGSYDRLGCDATISSDPVLMMRESLALLRSLPGHHLVEMPTQVQ